MGVTAGRAEERLAVVAAEQEGEAIQVAAQVRGAVSGIADEAGQRYPEAVGVAAEPVAEELQELSELGVSGHAVCT
jgi:hypothetical protein